MLGPGMYLEGEDKDDGCSQLIPRYLLVTDVLEYFGFLLSPTKA